MDKVNSIKFELLYQVSYGQIVCLKLINCPEYADAVIRMNCTDEIHDNTWSVVLYFADEDFKSNSKDN
jgi:hypothetical protein